jgi:oxygen-independent coproporphyrinogen-3 oxidase
MRMFRAPDLMVADAAGYRCQEDGMVGLGIGARSYTRTLHYSSEYAVDQGAIRRLIADWSRQSEAAFAVANHGIVMDDEDRRRRYLILCLLEAGLDRAAYHSRFGDDVMTHVPELEQALELGLADTRDSRLFLTEKGIEASDVIGQWLYSPRVRQLMESYQAQ